MTAVSVDDWGSATRHPTTADLERRQARMRVLAASQRKTEQHDATTRTEKKKRSKFHVDRLVDNALLRGIPLTCSGGTIRGTQPGDDLGELEKVNAYLSARVRSKARR